MLVSHGLVPLEQAEIGPCFTPLYEEGPDSLPLNPAPRINEDIEVYLHLSDSDDEVPFSVWGKILELPQKCNPFQRETWFITRDERLSQFLFPLRAVQAYRYVHHRLSMGY